eukprot:10182540-Lingulodinium_polyedra.AAC.1
MAPPSDHQETNSDVTRYDHRRPCLHHDWPMRPAHATNTLRGRRLAMKKKPRQSNPSKTRRK